MHNLRERVEIMAEEARYARTTISVPPDLKRRMEATEEVVNWSALACQAFEARLGEIASRKERKTMDDVIVRLRASKQREDDEDYRYGERQGRDWAANHASAYALKRLEGSRERNGPEWRSLFASYKSSTTPAERLADILLPPEEVAMSYDRSAEIEFWEDVMPSRRMPESDSFVRGFADGVLALWLEVKDQVDGVATRDTGSQVLSARETLVDRPIDTEDFVMSVQETPHEPVDPDQDLQRFWTVFLKHPLLQGSRHAGLPPMPRLWLSANAGRAGLAYNYNIQETWTDVELHINCGHGREQENYQIFAAIRQQQDEIEARFDGRLEWKSSGHEGNRTYHIRAIVPDVTYSQRARWSEMHDAMIKAMKRLMYALDPAIAKLTI
jgi:Domain of unknown function (DUF4268)